MEEKLLKKRRLLLECLSLTFAITWSLYVIALPKVFFSIPLSALSILEHLGYQNFS